MVLRERKESRSNWAGYRPGGSTREGEKCSLSAKRDGTEYGRVMERMRTQQALSLQCATGDRYEDSAHLHSLGVAPGTHTLWVRMLRPTVLSCSTVGIVWVCS